MGSACCRADTVVDSNVLEKDVDDFFNEIRQDN